ncbi:hypothetical protein U9M48_025210 [Paspalum notatum var. saurae]|uniref:Uncharacterized protein n=1 Tax=Paspalum notatum var. saurae TaxID=547442 RepID=A0AAQ3WXQ8_PASNO
MVQARPSLVTILGFLLLTFNAAMVVYSSDRGLGAVAFVTFCYLDISLLIYCLRLYAITPPGTPRREHLRVSMWLLTTALTFAFWPLLELWLQIGGPKT